MFLPRLINSAVSHYASLSGPCIRSPLFSGHRPFLEVVRGWRNFPARLQHGVVTIGNFDGVHRGHQEILGRLVREARRQQVPCVVFTFSPHPLAILRPESKPVPLTDFDTRARWLARYGVDVMVICETNRELLNLHYQDFFQQVVTQTLRPSLLAEGPNFHFGRGRQGTPEQLRQLCQSHGISLEIMEPKKDAGQMISSSLIRKCLSNGQMDTANQALGHPYELQGVVEHGDGRGKALGIPTANLGSVSTLVPADGVYAGIVHVCQRPYVAAVNIGAPVTFGKTDRRIEIHLLGFEGDLYGQRLRLQLVRRIREPREFASAELLKQQMQLDLRQIQQVVEFWNQEQAASNS